MILDASALLAYLQQEQGCLQIEQIMATAFISTVNWCEVLQTLRSRAVDEKAIRENLATLGLGFISFDLQYADKAGELWQITSPFGLSLGDRACLATGLIANMPVITADQVWQKLSLPLDVRLIR